MTDEHREPSFSSTDAVDVMEYPRVSRAAVLALLLGLASAAALASPVLWFLPLVGIAVAIAALKSIDRDSGGVLGRRTAVIGLVLSLVFITWAPCRYFVRNELLYRQAREHSAYFLDLILKGKLHEAHQLTLDKRDRQAPNANLNEYYSEQVEMAESFKSFCSQQPLDEIIALGDKGRVRFVGRRDIVVGRMLGQTIDIVTQEFAIDYEQGGQSQTLPVLIEIARTRFRGTGEAQWSIQGVNSPEAPDN
jgi:hypothetical protein